MDDNISLNLDDLTFKENPTRIWIFDNVLEENVFKHLKSKIKFDDKNTDGHGKRKLNGSYGLDKFLKENKLWSSFISHIEYGPNLIDKECFSSLESEPSSRRIGREISDLNEGSQVIPHKDKYSKVASFIFYFNETNEFTKNGVGATQFYVPHKKSKNSRLFNGSLAFDEVDLVCEVESIPNRLVVFQRSSSSWHVVQPITIKSFTRPVYIMALMRDRNLKDQSMEFLNRFL